MLRKRKIEFLLDEVGIGIDKSKHLAGGLLKQRVNKPIFFVVIPYEIVFI
jgi:hypothetical protein